MPQITSPLLLELVLVVYVAPWAQWLHAPKEFPAIPRKTPFVYTCFDLQWIWYQRAAVRPAACQGTALNIAFGTVFIL